MAAHNIKFFVVLIPCKEMIYGPSTREFDASALLVSYDELGRRLENDGIRVLNLSTSFVDAELRSKKDVLFLRADAHLTESGHQAVADMIVRFMQDNGLQCLE